MSSIYQLSRTEVLWRLPDATDGLPLNAGSVTRAHILALPVLMCLACPTVKSPLLISRMLGSRLGRYRIRNDGEHFGGRIWVTPQPPTTLSMEDLVVLLLSDDSGGIGIRVIFRMGV